MYKRHFWYLTTLYYGIISVYNQYVQNHDMRKKSNGLEISKTSFVSFVLLGFFHRHCKFEHSFKIPDQYQITFCETE